MHWMQSPRTLSGTVGIFYYGRIINSATNKYFYNSSNGLLNAVVNVTDGNGYIEEYTYDELENLSEIWYTVGGVKTLAYSYEYNADGSVYKITDHVNGILSAISATIPALGNAAGNVVDAIGTAIVWFEASVLISVGDSIFTNILSEISKV